MKIIILVVINLVVTIYSESTDIRLSSLLRKLHKLESMYLDKYAENVDSLQLEEFEIASYQFAKLFLFEMRNLCSTDYAKDVASVNSINKVKGYLDTNEKYLPDFIINANERFRDRLCKRNEFGSINDILDFLKESSNGKCNLSGSNDYIECFYQLNILNNLDKNDYSLNRIDVCSDLKTSQKCIIKILQTNCEIAKEHVDFLNSAFEELLVECSLANTNMFNFVLLATLVTISYCF